MISKKLFSHFYPDLSKDGTHRFYNWVREYTNAESVLLNLGAGPPTRQELRIFKGEVARVVGADIDPIVLDNDELDEAATIQDGRLPFPDNTFDIVVSDYTFEHVQSPVEFLGEAYRVLKPGAHLFFRTPSKYHYVAFIAAATPHWFHKLVANRARALADDTHEPWPTVYKLNSPRALNAMSREVGFRDVELRTHEAEPSYMVFATIPFLIGVAYERVVNAFDALEPLRANIFGRLTK